MADLRTDGPGPARSLGLDHVVALTGNLDLAARGFERLGFRVTPRTSHSDLLGTENRCVILRHGYIEFLSIRAPTPANAAWRARLDREGDTWAGAALYSPDLGASLAGLCPGERAAPMSFSRATAAGVAEFSIAMLRLPGLEGLDLFYCQHHTPQCVWSEPEMQHPNGALGLSGLAIVASDLEAATSSLRRAGLSADLDASVAEPPSAALTRVSVVVSDLSELRRRLAASGLSWREAPARLSVPAQPNFPFALELRA